MFKIVSSIVLTAALAVGGAIVMPASAGVGSYTVVIGDSLSNYAKSNLRGYRPDWDIDAVNGSSPATLPGRIDAAVKRHGGQHPETIVVELGTNYSSSWSGSDYGIVRQKLPKTRIVFVTPGRDPFVVGRPSAQRAAGYAYHMVRIANADPRACIVPWAEAVAQNPALLSDGVHAKVEHRDRWAREVVKGTDACKTTEP